MGSLTRRTVVYLVAAVVLIAITVALRGQAPQLFYPVLAAAVVTSAVATVVLVRSGRDPNGPPGQH